MYLKKLYQKEEYLDTWKEELFGYFSRSDV